MATNIVQMTDGTGNKQYPVTSAEAVGMPDGSGNLTNYLDKRVTEYNVSVLHPTSGSGGSNKYTLETAIAQVPSKYRSVGIKCAFVNEAGKSECWKYQGSSWVAASFVKEADGGNKILEWKTDAATTRKQVALSERKAGMQISYKPSDNSDWVNEQYIGESFTDTEWEKDDNWEKTPNQRQITNQTHRVNALDTFLSGYYKNLMTIGEDTLYLTDKYGNIIMKVDSNGFDVSSFSERLLNYISSQIVVSLESVVDKYNDTLFITDKVGNIIMKVDAQGIESIGQTSGGDTQSSVFNGLKMVNAGDSLSTSGIWQQVLVDKLGIKYSKEECTTENNAAGWIFAKGGRGFMGWSAVKSALLIDKLSPDIITIMTNGFQLTNEDDYIFDKEVYHIEQLIEKFDFEDLQEAINSVEIGERKINSFMVLGSSQILYRYISKTIDEWQSISSWEQATGKKAINVLAGCVEVMQKRNPGARIYWIIPTLFSPTYEQRPLLYDDAEHINVNKVIAYYSKCDRRSEGDVLGSNYYKSYEICREIANLMGIGLLDMMEYSGINYLNTSEFYGDNPNIHPAEKGYIRWGETMANLMV